MVRKIIACFVVSILLVGAFCTQASAETHSVYDEGTLSSTYTTYFKDIVSGIGFNDNYVAFRSGQYSYTMVVGDLKYSNGVLSLNSQGKEYIFTTSSGYNGNTTYTVKNISNFSLNCGNYIIYSDLGDYPQLMERGAKYEMLSTLLIIICCCCFVISRIFYYRKR